jgi:hypothetical protein
MNKEKEKEDEIEERQEHDPIEAQISTFASMIGQETGNKYFAYVYRVGRDEESGQRKNKYLKRTYGIEPDPQEIAEKFRGGKYLITFVWKHGNKQKTKSYTLDIDEDAFPALPKDAAGNNQIMTIAGTNNMPDAMKMQLIMMQTIGEVMKEAYKANNVALSGHSPAAPVDPYEQFGGLLQAMEQNYSGMMKIQSTMFQRMFEKTMENKLGLEPVGGAADAPIDTQDVILGKYGPLIKELVGGLKIVLETFGNKVPKEVVRRVQSDDRFKELRSNPKALLEVGQTLRREFGDERARNIMRSFGVDMVIKPVQQVIQTPDIPVKAVPGPSKIEPRGKGGNGKVKGEIRPKMAAAAVTG